jgi:hypothetical protein
MPFSAMSSQQELPRSRLACYLVLHREDAWYIRFADEYFGPYRTEAEAQLFALDAAQKLGSKGERILVLRQDENGGTHHVQSFGPDGV